MYFLYSFILLSIQPHFTIFLRILSCFYKLLIWLTSFSVRNHLATSVRIKLIHICAYIISLYSNRIIFTSSYNLRICQRKKSSFQRTSITFLIFFIIFSLYLIPLIIQSVFLKTCQTSHLFILFSLTLFIQRP
jgi:hypothetical protein